MKKKKKKNQKTGNSYELCDRSLNIEFDIECISIDILTTYMYALNRIMI